MNQKIVFNSLSRMQSKDKNGKYEKGVRWRSSTQVSVFSKIGWEDRKNGRESVFKEINGLIFSRIETSVFRSEKHKPQIG